MRAIVCILSAAVLVPLAHTARAASITVADIRSLAALNDRADQISSASGKALMALVSAHSGSTADRDCLSEMEFEAQLTGERILAVRQLAYMDGLEGGRLGASAQGVLESYLTDQLAKWPRQREEVEDLGGACLEVPFAADESRQLVKLLDDSGAAISVFRDKVGQVPGGTSPRHP